MPPPRGTTTSLKKDGPVYVYELELELLFCWGYWGEGSWLRRGGRWQGGVPGSEVCVSVSGACVP